MLNDKTLRLLWNKCAIGTAILDSKGYFLEVNEKLCEMLEYTEVELIGKHFNDITVPSDQKADLEMARKVVAGEIDHYTMTKTYIKKSGYPIQIDLLVYAVTREDGDFELFLSQMVPRVNIKPMHKASEMAIDPSVLFVNWLTNNKKFLVVVLGTLTAVMAALTALFEFLNGRV